MKVAAIVGPTAVGKTDVSISVAEALDAEIVSVDSMQAYWDMNIGTAKPSPDQRRRVPHHLIDMRDPSDDLTVADYQQKARAAIEEIARRGRLPLLVGGSGLYFRAIVDDLVFPPRDQAVRTALEAKAEQLGAEALHARLGEVDPAAAAKIEPANARRTIRALEVIAVTGSLFSENASWERYESRYRLAVAGVTMPRDRLYARINERARAMIGEGLVEEAHRLAHQGLSQTARQALGYRQVLDAPEGAGKQQIADEIARATRRFARRQESWFASDPRVVWFDASADYVADQLIAFFRSALALPLVV